jgi:hypothetical protein
MAAGLNQERVADECVGAVMVGRYEKTAGPL